MSAFDMHEKAFVTKKKKKMTRKKMLDAELFLFFLYFSVPFTSLSLPFPLEWNETKISINILPPVSIVEGCLKRTCERKSILHRMSLKLCKPGQRFIIIYCMMYCIMLPMINIAALEAILTCINRSHPVNS